MELAAQFGFAAQFMIDIITIRDRFRICRNVGKNIGDELYFRRAVTDILCKKLYRQITAGVRADLEKFFVRISRNAHLSQYFPSTESIIGISAL